MSSKREYSRIYNRSNRTVITSSALYMHVASLRSRFTMADNAASRTTCLQNMYDMISEIEALWAESQRLAGRVQTTVMERNCYVVRTHLEHAHEIYMSLLSEEPEEPEEPEEDFLEDILSRRD